MVLLTLNVSYGETSFGESLAVVGEGPAFGNWAKPLQLSGEDFPRWSLTITVPCGSCSYKYVVVTNGRIIRWEELPDGLNRTLHVGDQPDSERHVIVNDHRFGSFRSSLDSVRFADEKVSVEEKASVEEKVSVEEEKTAGKGDKLPDVQIETDVSENCSLQESTTAEPAAEDATEEDVTEEEDREEDCGVVKPETVCLTIGTMDPEYCENPPDETSPLLGDSTVSPASDSADERWDLVQVEDYMNEELSITAAELSTLAARLHQLRKGKGSAATGGVAEVAVAPNVCSSLENDDCSAAEALTLARELIADATLSLEDVENSLRRRGSVQTERQQRSGCRTMCMLAGGAFVAAAVAVLAVDPRLVALPV